jgi:MYXO-CTERM domain-containing protein
MSKNSYPSRAAAALSAAVTLVSALRAQAAPIALHPSNPHYFLFRGKPTVLVTSGEHYGAVLNLDFDYIPYLDELKSRGLNMTRLWSGVYMESASSFNIEKNTLAPKDGRYIGPWARSASPGYAGGGNKFDLSAFDDAYFTRLKDFLSKASERNIVVEYVLFCPFYDDSQWALSPMKASNNVNGVGNVDKTTAMTLNNGGLLAIQDSFVRKVAAELKDFDNFYYEISNEPYFGVADAFQDHVIATLSDAESGLAGKHLFARNYCNDKCTVMSPPPAISIFNFHYAHPPDAVGLNYGANRALSYDETGFEGTGDEVYRKEAWAFLLAGGAIFDNLDYSFTADNESGDFKPTTSPGGGSVALRTQLGTLKRFMEQFDFVRMKPDASVIKSGAPNPSYVLAEAGRQYAMYLQGGTQANLTLDLPAETYTLQWVDPKSGTLAKSETFTHAGGMRQVSSPTSCGDGGLPCFTGGDMALSIKSKTQLDAEAAAADAGSVEAGSSDGGSGFDVAVGQGSGGSTNDAQAFVDVSAAATLDAGANAGAGGAGTSSTVSDDSGCGCRMAGRTGKRAPFAALVAGSLALLRRRRRR